MESIQTTEKTAMIYNNSQITLHKIQNSNIHTYIIEEIRRKLIEVRKTGWKITLRWVKAHAGIRGNERADTLAKKAATKENITEDYKKVPKSIVKRELEEASRSGKENGSRQPKEARRMNSSQTWQKDYKRK